MTGEGQFTVQAEDSKADVGARLFAVSVNTS
jgi:hypothetical protein